MQTKNFTQQGKKQQMSEHEEEDESSSKWVAVDEEDDDEEEEEQQQQAATATATTTTAAAKQTLKDLINVTNFAGDVEDDDPDNYDSVIKVVDGETVFQQQQQQQQQGPNSSSTTNPFQNVMDKTVTSIRHSMSEHVTPKVESFVQGTQLGITKIGDSIRSNHVTQQHVVPFVTKAHEGIQELQQSTQKGFNEFGQNTKQVVDRFGQNTKQLVDTHVVPQLQHVQQISIRSLKEVETSSKEFTTKHISPHLEEIQQQSKSVVKTTTRLVLDKYNITTTYIYNNRHYFWNSAPGLTTVTTATAAVASSSSIGNASGRGGRSSDWKQLYLLLEESTARSFGQVVFCNNPVTGLLVWFAILLSASSPLLAAVCSLVCVVTVRVTPPYLV